MRGWNRGRKIWIAAGVALALAGAGTATPSARGAEGGADGRRVWIGAGGGAREVTLPAGAERVFAAGPEGVLFTAKSDSREPTDAGAGRGQAGVDHSAGSDLWRVGPEGGAAKRLVEGGVLRAAWSGEARLLAVVTAGLEIRLLHEDGALWKTLPRRGQSPAFSPDGTRLAYAAAPASWRPGSQPGGFDLRVLDLRSGRDRRLTAGYDDAEPIWRPDGKSIVFVSGGRTGLTSLWSIGLDGKGLRQLSHAGERAASAPAFVPNPTANTDASWSPDGRSLLYAAEYGEAGEAGEIVALDFGREGALRAVKRLGAGTRPVWQGGKVVALRAGKWVGLSPAAAQELAIPPIPSIPPIPPSAKSAAPKLPPFGERIARGDEALRPAGQEKMLATLFRWPATFYPAPTPTAFFVDQDARAGFLLSNWCNNQTYDGHLGSDIQLACNNVVLGARGGVINWRNDGCPNVGFAGSTCGGGFGNFAQINHNNGWYTIYAHLKSGTVAPLGATGNCGDPVGTSQTSGNSSGCHLHFEVRTYSGATYWVWDPYNGPCTNAGLWCTNAATQFPGMGCC